jgi:hypothetical protein
MSTPSYQTPRQYVENLLGELAGMYPTATIRYRQAADTHIVDVTGVKDTDEWEAFCYSRREEFEKHYPGESLFFVGEDSIVRVTPEEHAQTKYAPEPSSYVVLGPGFQLLAYGRSEDETVVLDRLDKRLDMLLYVVFAHIRDRTYFDVNSVSEIFWGRLDAMATRLAEQEKELAALRANT